MFHYAYIYISFKRYHHVSTSLFSTMDHDFSLCLDDRISMTLIALSFVSCIKVLMLFQAICTAMEHCTATCVASGVTGLRYGDQAALLLGLNPSLDDRGTGKALEVQVMSRKGALLWEAAGCCGKESRLFVSTFGNGEGHAQNLLPKPER